MKLSEDGEVLCPRCGSQYLHQNKVEVWDRKGESQEGAHISTSNHSLSVDSDMSQNPSDRRDATEITFWCEECEGGESVLRLVQHKGITYAKMFPKE